MKIKLKTPVCRWASEMKKWREDNPADGDPDWELKRDYKEYSLRECVGDPPGIIRDPDGTKTWLNPDRVFKYHPEYVRARNS